MPCLTETSSVILYNILFIYFPCRSTGDILIDIGCLHGSVILVLDSRVSLYSLVILFQVLVSDTGLLQVNRADNLVVGLLSGFLEIADSFFSYYPCSRSNHRSSL